MRHRRAPKPARRTRRTRAHLPMPRSRPVSTMICRGSPNARPRCTSSSRRCSARRPRPIVPRSARDLDKIAAENADVLAANAKVLHAGHEKILAAEERDRTASRRARCSGEDDQRIADDEDVRRGRRVREGDRSLARRVVKRGLIFLLIAIPAIVIAQPSGAPPAAGPPHRDCDTGTDAANADADACAAARRIADACTRLRSHVRPHADYRRRPSTTPTARRPRPRPSSTIRVPARTTASRPSTRARPRTRRRSARCSRSR